MADQMENLTPEQLEEMSKMASSMGPRAAGSGASTSGDSGGDPMAAMNNSDMMGMMEEQVRPAASCCLPQASGLACPSLPSAYREVTAGACAG